MAEFAGFELLERFESNWGHIKKDGARNVAFVKKFTETLSEVQQKYLRMNNQFSRLNKHLQMLPSLLESVNNITITLGRLEGHFNDIEEIFLLLESVCEEQEEVSKILEKQEDLHSLKMKKQKELEDMKAQLANEHSCLLQEMERKRQERRKKSEEAIKNGIWKIEDDPTTTVTSDVELEETLQDEIFDS